MIDIKSVREEMARIHAEATSFEEKFSAADASATEAEQTAQDERFATLDRLAKSIENAEKLAKHAFTKEAPAPGVKVELPRKSPDQMAVEAFENKADEEVTFETYTAALSAWVKGEDAEEFATITTVTGGGVMLPKMVTAPLTPIRRNPYRAAMAYYGVEPENFGNLAPANVPVVSSNSGGELPEDGSRDTDGNPSVGVIPLAPKGYQSGTYWYSGLQIGAVDWNVAQSTLPALMSAKEHGFTKAISAKIAADAAGGSPVITQSVATATISTVSIDNLDDVIQRLPQIYDQNKAVILNTAVYNAFDKLKDSTGVPLMSRNDIQGISFLSYKGVPVLKDDSLPAFGANAVVGVVISLDGFKIRDEAQKLKTYDNDADRPDKTGLNQIGYHAVGYVPEAVAVLKCPAS